MGYLNPVHAYGYERFARDAGRAGVDGVLLVDMPPEEADSFLPHAATNGLNVIFLLTPTSDESRIATVDRLGRGFIYYVTVTGVTGARSELPETLTAELARVRERIRLPVMAGFGISTPQQAASVAAHADGVVVGSAIVKLFEQYSGSRLRDELRNLVTSLKQAVSG
jgi:tryptophan synthase alpha chain